MASDDVDADVEMAEALAHQNPTPTFHCVTIPSVTVENLTDLLKSFEDTHPSLTRAALRDVPFDKPVSDQFAVLQVKIVQGCTTNDRTKKRQWKMDAMEIQPDGCRNLTFALVMEEYLPCMKDEMPVELRARLNYFDFLSAPVILMVGFIKEKSQWFSVDSKNVLRCGPQHYPQVLIATLPPPSSQPSPATQTQVLSEQDKLCLPNSSYSLPAHTGYKPLSQLTVGGPYHIVAIVRYAIPPRITRSFRGHDEWMMSLGLVDPSLDILNNVKFKLFLFTRYRNNLPEAASAGDVLLVRNVHVKEIPKLNETTGIGYADSVRFAFVPSDAPKMTSAIIRNSSSYFLNDVDRTIISNLRNWYQGVASVIDKWEKVFGNSIGFVPPQKRVTQPDTGTNVQKPPANGLPTTGIVNAQKKPLAAGIPEQNRQLTKKASGNFLIPTTSSVLPRNAEKRPLSPGETGVDAQFAEKASNNVPLPKKSAVAVRDGIRAPEVDDEERTPSTMEFASWNTITEPAKRLEGDIWSEKGMFVERNKDGSVRCRDCVLELVKEDDRPRCRDFVDFVLKNRVSGKQTKKPVDFEDKDLQFCVTQ